MPRTGYTTLDQVQAKLPLDFITDALDDDKDGMADDAVWQLVAADAADQVDERLGKRYTVPFAPDSLPPAARSASLLFVLETLYQRRGFGTPETNPFLASARAARAELEKIGNGASPLTTTAQRPRPSVAVFSEPARSTSAHGNLSA